MSENNDNSSGNDARSIAVNAKTLVFGALAVAAAGGAGSAMGLTIEPASVTEIRVENARMRERLDLLEPIVRDCQALVSASRVLSDEEGEE